MKSNELVVGSQVSVPFDEEGVLLEIKNLPWGFTHIVQITKGSAMNCIGDIVDYRKEQVVLIK